MTAQTRPTFTPGPWRVDKPHPYSGTISAEVNGHRFSVTQVGGIDLSDGPEGTDDANATLIAAAPEMYEALRRLIADNCLDGPECGHVSAVRAALARAEGR